MEQMESGVEVANRGRSYLTEQQTLSHLVFFQCAETTNAVQHTLTSN